MLPHTHAFKKIAERYLAWELNLTDDSSGGLIEKLKGVMPELMPDNEVLIYQWVAPRKDPHSGQPTEVARLRLFRVPIGKSGPLVGAITKCIDEMDAPKEVRMPDKLDIPPEVDSMKDEDLDTIAPQIGLTFPMGADIRVKKVLVARECNTSARGKMVLQRISEAISRIARPVSEPLPSPDRTPVAART